MGKVQGWPPSIVTPVPLADRRRGDGLLVAEFVEALCPQVKDSVGGKAGEPLHLRPWQHELLAHLFARRKDGRYRHRLALVGLPRKSGKSALGSGIALYGLLMGPRGGEVYSCAADRDQARIVFGTAKAMVEASPELNSQVKLYRDAIEVPGTGSVYRVLSSEAFTKEGLSPTLVVYDELHAAPNDELFNVMQLGQAARIDALTLAITTAGVRTDQSGKDSTCYRLYQYGQRIAAGEIDDPSFFQAWWSVPDKSDHRDPKVWRAANPGFGDLQDPEDFASAVLRTPENEFKTKRLNMWVEGSHAWLPHGSWDVLADRGREPIFGEDAVLALDGSFNNDSTALVRWRLGGDKPHLDVVGLWERPHDAPGDWHVPVAEVEKVIVDVTRNGDCLVREVVFDPARWMRTMQVLEDEGLPIVSYPQAATRMVPATQRFYEAVLNQSFTHSGDPRLARHVSNCVTKQSTRGVMVAKSAFSRKIDAAVAAIFGYDRAMSESAHVDVSAQVW